MEEKIEEITNLIYWFNSYYTIHEQKYRRLQTLGDETAYQQLLELYQEAEIKRVRIQELEETLKNEKIISEGDVKWRK